MRKKPHRIGVTSGDPAGIGPEVAVKAITDIKDDTIAPILIGRDELFREYFNEYFSSFNIITNLEPHSRIKTGVINFYNIPFDSPIPEPGAGSIKTGMESLTYIDTAIDLWKSGALDAVVTGPVSKELIGKSRISFSGHTEYIAQRIGEQNPLMMMFSDKYRVLLATTHIPVKAVPQSINKYFLLEVLQTGYQVVQSIDKGKVTLAVCGMDPHAGDGGVIGKFDMEITRPAIIEARHRGIDIEGPFAADTLFLPDRWERYNLVIAHYHDQGLIPFKMMAFDTGVNVTVGLSLIRTSVDHGTAFDIAGTGKANCRSMVEAIRLASRLLANRED